MCRNIYVWSVYTNGNMLHCFYPFIYLFLRQSLLCGLGWSTVWQELSSLQSPPPGPKPSSLTSASWVAGMIGTLPSCQASFWYFVEMRFPHVGRTGLKLLSSSDPPTSASQRVGITAASHHGCSCFYSLTWMVSYYMLGMFYHFPFHLTLLRIGSYYTHRHSKTHLFCFYFIIAV